MGEQNPLESVTEEIGVQKRIPLVQSSEVEICHFCGEPIIKLNGRDAESLCEHHLNGNHYDNHPENVVTAHFGCHAFYHASKDNRRPRITKEEGIRKAYGDNIVCFFCGEPIIKLFGNNSDSFMEHHISYDPEVVEPSHFGCNRSYHTKGKNNPMYRNSELAEKGWINRKEEYGPSGGQDKVWSTRRERYGSSGVRHSEKQHQRTWATRHRLYGPTGLKDPEARYRALRETMIKTGAYKKGWITRKERYGPSGRRSK